MPLIEAALGKHRKLENLLKANSSPKPCTTLLRFYILPLRTNLDLKLGLWLRGFSTFFYHSA